MTEIDKIKEGNSDSNVILNEREDLDNHTDLNSTTESDIISRLNELSEEELLKILNENNLDSSVLSKENAVYKYILKQESILNDVGLVETDIPESVAESGSDTLTYTEKCSCAIRLLAHLKENLKNINSCNTEELKELKFKLESLNMTLASLKKAMEYFNKDILEKHPITKKVISQKVAKFINDSIKHKRTVAYRYKIQIEGFTMECNKLMNQIKDQNKRLASLDLVKYQETKYEHQKMCEALVKQKKNLVLYKSKYSSLIQNVAKLKKALEEEESKLTEIHEALSGKDHMKSVMLSEKSYNDQKVQELNEAMHKIKVDPQRHDLPEVVDYARVKRQNENLHQSIKLWRKKVAVAEQAKLMYLSARRKKRIT